MKIITIIRRKYVQLSLSKYINMTPKQQQKYNLSLNTSLSITRLYLTSLLHTFEYIICWRHLKFFVLFMYFPIRFIFYISVDAKCYSKLFCKKIFSIPSKKISTTITRNFKKNLKNSSFNWTEIKRRSIPSSRPT